MRHKRFCVGALIWARRPCGLHVISVFLLKCIACCANFNNTMSVPNGCTLFEAPPTAPLSVLLLVKLERRMNCTGWRYVMWLFRLCYVHACCYFHQGSRIRFCLMVKPDAHKDDRYVSHLQRWQFLDVLFHAVRLAQVNFIVLLIPGYNFY